MNKSERWLLIIIVWLSAGGAMFGAFGAATGSQVHMVLAAFLLFGSWALAGIFADKENAE